jgi:hypothetical protein
METEVKSNAVEDEQESKAFDWTDAERAFASLAKTEQDAVLARLAELRRPVEYRYQPDTESAEILELLIPERLEYLSALYEFLHGQLSAPGHSALFKGFSVIEVKGGFKGERVYYEPTLIVRLIYDRAQFMEEAKDKGARVMRMVYHGFHDGTYHLFQTEDNGKNRRTLENTRPDVRVRRLTVFIEVGCSNNEQGLQELQEGLDKIARELQREGVLVGG